MFSRLNHPMDVRTNMNIIIFMVFLGFVEVIFVFYSEKMLPLIC